MKISCFEKSKKTHMKTYTVQSFLDEKPTTLFKKGSSLDFSRQMAF